MRRRDRTRPGRRLMLAHLVSFLVVGSALAKDFRNFDQGHAIPDEGYCDQPYIVVTKDGNWLCTLTTGKGREGQRGQHVIATVSSDRGRTWSPLIDIEPADGPEASWVVPLVTPGGRVYAFYNYNGDKVGHGSADFALPDGRTRFRADTVGWYCYRYSDDHGRSWSERFRLPMPQAACDRGNQWQGRVQVFWGIDKPKTAGGVAFFGFTRLGRWLGPLPPSAIPPPIHQRPNARARNQPSQRRRDLAYRRQHSRPANLRSLSHHLAGRGQLSRRPAAMIDATARR